MEVVKMSKVFLSEQVASAKAEIKEMKDMLKINTHFSESTKAAYAAEIERLNKFIKQNKGGC
jgi:hypothetical protein